MRRAWRGFHIIPAPSHMSLPSWGSRHFGAEKKPLPHWETTLPGLLAFFLFCKEKHKLPLFQIIFYYRRKSTCLWSKGQIFLQTWKINSSLYCKENTFLWSLCQACLLPTIEDSASLSLGLLFCNVTHCVCRCHLLSSHHSVGIGFQGTDMRKYWYSKYCYCCEQ